MKLTLSLFVHPPSVSVCFSPSFSPPLAFSYAIIPQGTKSAGMLSIAARIIITSRHSTCSNPVSPTHTSWWLVLLLSARTEYTINAKDDYALKRVLGNVEIH